MQCTARFLGHGFGKERCVHLVFDRGLANRTLEQEYLVGKLYGIAMQEVRPSLPCGGSASAFGSE